MKSRDRPARPPHFPALLVAALSPLSPLSAVLCAPGLPASRCAWPGASSMRVPAGGGPAGPGRQRGLAAVGLALAVLMFSGILLGTTYLAQGAGNPRHAALDQLENLVWAQGAVDGFAAVHGRLPCPASSRAGFEDCSVGAKGWLPVRSLDTLSAVGAVSTLDMRYLVYRGNGTDTPPDPDLAADPLAPGEAYTPQRVDGAAVAGYGVHRSGLDLCAKLRGLLPPAAGSPRWGLADPATGGPANPVRAHIPGVAGGAVVNIAYGVSVADAGVTGDASGINADLATPAFEAPDRAHDARYADMVRAVDARALHDAMSCGITTASVDTLATAQSWSDDAAGYRQGNIEAGAAVTDILKFFLVADGLGALMATADLANGIHAGGVNAVKLTTALVGLPFTLPAVMTYLAGIASAVAGLGLNALDFTGSAAGLTLDSMYTAAYADVARDATAIPVWHGGTAVLTAADLQGVNGD